MSVMRQTIASHRLLSQIKINSITAPSRLSLCVNTCDPIPFRLLWGLRRYGKWAVEDAEIGGFAAETYLNRSELFYDVHVPQLQPLLSYIIEKTIN